jgi:two-component system response regulator
MAYCDKDKMIFIVDDSPTDIELVTIALEAVGLQISICSTTDGKSALAILRNKHELPALILLDINMPGMDGIEVLREIRAHDRLREIPVVIVTSSALESDRADAIAAGASGYLQKPLALAKFTDDLKSIVHRWLPN